MKKRIVVLTCLLLVAMLVSLLPKTAFAANEGTAVQWKVKSLDGTTYTQDSFPNQYVLLIVYRATMEDDEGRCWNSNSTIKNLVKSDWISNPNLKIIASDCDENSQADIQKYKDKYAPDCSDIIFANSDYRSISTQLRSYGISAGSTLAFCYICYNGRILDSWDTNTTAYECRIKLAKYIDFGEEYAMRQLKVSGQLQQSDARTLLNKINAFRAEPSVWEWNSDNTTKTYYNQSGATYLNALTYDYNLEQIAIQRAEEIAVLFSHTRPNGENCFTITVNGTQSYGECIAMGQDSVQSAFDAWREENEYYYGQGHRRLMLEADYKAVGCACFAFNGRLHWVLEFGYTNSGASKTTANDSATTAYVWAHPEFILSPFRPSVYGMQESQAFSIGKTATLHVYATGENLVYQWYYRKSASGSWIAVTADSGKTDTYSFTAQEKHNGYQYRCKVENSELGFYEYSNIVTVKTGYAPTITTQPTSQYAAFGDSVTFKVTATGSDLKYQWYYWKQGSSTTTEWSGKTSSSFTVKASEKNNGCWYYCRISNEFGTEYSDYVKLYVGDPPAITTQPTSKTVANGGTATFAVVADGTVTYQWQYSKNNGSTWTDWSGKTGSILSFNGSETNNGYLYRCVVTNIYGSTTSGSARLTVTGVKPKITAQPAAQTVASGKAATFKVVAGGSGKTYQWYYSKNNGSTWTKWSGKTSAALSFTGSEVNNGYLYRCVVKNSYGSVTSSSARLTVSNVKPKILTNPAAQTVASGKAATFKVAAGGSGKTYQWYYSKNNGSTWTKWSGKTSATLSFTGSEVNNGYLYRCVVKNSYGSVTSSSARLTVTGVKPKILTNPAAQTVVSGKAATFKVAAGGSGKTYQWYYSKNNGSTWTKWSGKTSATLSFNGSEVNNGYLYRCVVKNSYGSVTSSSARLTVTGVKPKILTNPANKTVASGTTITMKVVAGGSGLSYQWQYSKNNGSTWTNWSGKTTSSITFKATSTNNGYQYRCRVKNSYGTVYSSAATLKLK